MKIIESVFNAVIRHCRHELPHEACGYLAADNGVISRHYVLTNTDEAADHFSMDPREQFAAVKDMRDRGLALAAVYHSHPDTPARPSEEDIRLAYDPEVGYVIVSLADNKCEIKAFRIKKGIVTPEEITVIPGPSQPETHGGNNMTASTVAPQTVKNCRGVGCPMNLVYAKVELAKLKSGEVLEIILDDGAPINNVPRAAEKEGHSIVSRARLVDGAWSVLIRKK